MNKKSVVLTALLVLCAIGFLAFSDNLIQDNREDLFLSESFQEKLLEDRSLNSIYDSIVLNLDFENEEQWNSFHEQMDEVETKFDDLTWMSPKTISGISDFAAQSEFYKDSSLLKLVEGKDAIFFFHLDSKNPVIREELVKQINTVSDKLNLRPRFAGMPYLNVKLGEMSLQIKKIVMPILFVSVAILLRLLLGNNFLTIACFVPSLFGVGISLTLIKLIWGHSTMVTTLVPILVFLVLLSLTLHLALGAAHFKNVQKAWEEKRLAIYLALATTILGLFSLVTSDIPAIRQFAITSCIALFVSAVVGLLYWKNLVLNFSTPRRHFSQWIKRIDWQAPLAICAAFLFAFGALGLWGWSKINFQVEALYFFPASSSMVKDWRHVESRLGGLPLVDIHYEVDNKDDSVLASLSSYESALSVQLHSDFKLLSPNGIVKEANAHYAGESQLPESLTAYQLLLGRVPSQFRPSFDRNLYTLSILGETLSTSDYQDWIESLELPSNARLGGLYYWMMRSQQGLIKAMTQSFFLGLVCVTLFLLIMMRSLVSAAIFFVVNIIPALCTLSIFYLLGKELNVASITTFSISFGLIVDSTLHLMVHYRRHGHVHDTFIYETVFAPMLVVTAVMVIGFSLLGFYEFAPVGDFGLAMGFTLFFGFILDFYILPVLERVLNSNRHQSAQ